MSATDTASSCQRTQRGVSITGVSGRCLEVELLTANILRIRVTADGSRHETGLIRYGFFEDAWKGEPCDVRETADEFIVTADRVAVSIAKADLRLRVAQADGNVVIEEAAAAEVHPHGGYATHFALPAEMRFFGLGDQTRERLEHRGTVADLWVRNVSSYIPIPFLLSNRGCAIVVNDTHRILFDLGHADAAKFGFSSPDGFLDYYLLLGDTPQALIQRYVELTGKPALPPKWSFGLWFLCHILADSRDMMDDAYKFRSEGIPCDAISLEPGWMEKNYDYSVDKRWHPERFHIPSWSATGPHTFHAALRRMGFKLGLWLCNDYDLSFEEERRLAAAQAMNDAALVGSRDAAHEDDEHLQGVHRMDSLTRPGEPWFGHLQKFVDQGAEFFKQDGASQVLSHPDRKWGNGMDDAEMHNLYPLLYAKQMHLGFREHTGRRACGFTVAGWAGLQRYTGTWAGDTGGNEGPLAASLNLSLSGHHLTTCDMEVTTKAGIHFGFLQPWAQLNSWAYWRHPWLLGDELKPVFTDYARLRYRLLPFIYSYAHEAHRTGVGVLRAMPLEYPHDPATYNLLRQYHFGREFLVSVFTDEVYLPEGEWVDYWTGDHYVGPQTMAYTPPDNRGGGLFVRAGAIIPLGPQIDYVGQQVEDVLTLEVFPGADASFTMIEDDGSSYDYEQGAVATTRFATTGDDGGITFTASPREGSYAGMTSDRRYRFLLHLSAMPALVKCAADLLPAVEEDSAAVGWWYAADRSELHVNLPLHVDEGGEVRVQF